MRSLLLLLSAVVGATAWPGLSATGADRHAAGADRPGQTVKACSSYGNGCLVAPVRRGRFGLEARLKSGTWIDCRGDCREAIRQDVLDFWETQSDKAMAIH